MGVPLFHKGELLRFSRFIGSLMTCFGGLVLILQSALTGFLPPPPNYAEVTAIVVNLEQRGTFFEPAFSLTLDYTLTNPDGSPNQIRSGRRVSYEDYFSLKIGDDVRIHYNQSSPYDWQIIEKPTASQYAIPILMAVLGLFSLAFPLIVRVASRQEDFEYREQGQA